jgi:general secretion pathway protein G
VSRSLPSSHGEPCDGVPGRVAGFTLLELMFAVAFLGLLLAVALPGYQNVIERQKIAQACTDLMTLSMKIEIYRVSHPHPPPSLSDIGGAPRDPWGNEYQYLSFSADTPGIQGMIRKDHNLHPLNSDFDLYSKGPDGQSRPPLTARASRDDIIYARDGAFIGKAVDF